MPVPKMKVSRSRRNKRSANKNITLIPISECQTCRQPLASHCVCKECGYYKGIKILRTKNERMHERGQLRAAQHATRQQAAPDSSAE